LLKLLFFFSPPLVCHSKKNALVTLSSRSLNSTIS
jgi:hypothetical protein